jgi:predicted amidophosphoribosyltransferase
MLQTLLDFIYPRHCQICDDPIAGQEKWVCSNCFQALELLNNKGRCKRCFHLLHRERCERCVNKASSIHSTLALFQEGVQTAKLFSLAHLGPYRDTTSLIASFYVLQYFRNNNTPPDYITFASRSTSHKTMTRLSKEVAKLMETPQFADTRKPLKPKCSSLSYLIISDRSLSNIEEARLATFLAPHLPKRVQLIAFSIDDE